ncbi:MAG: 3-hydroxyacyl-[acyl-carrier-protein] dehydratase, FabZ form [Candidatus Ozemobacter sibiricus]|uniref:3-hydroxyacyl-[acyl-carrier-protein] dehydratase, FabZ form n=1 Tax=Candidatus Ozemobacter sibiricus TaxID=2268124 RepID=A0A367ZU91_9BACT|nr:MAG: 3-hydroxyacyl-[acyl-carrier-protein] dehydratase, FabZ form [Candidatus Ozemobacter sibiricus]
MRFYFVDRITDLVPGQRIRGYKNVAMSEPYFATHFPGFPVVPGVVLIEAMAQLAGLLVETTPEGKDRKALLSIVDRVKFKKMVRPGDRVDLAADLVLIDEEGARVEVAASVDGEAIAQTRLTFVLLKVPAPFVEVLAQERAALLHALRRR